jgi:hypothetical protein
MSSHEGGVSFWDVRHQAEMVGHLYNCIVHFEMHLPMRANQNHSWQVRAVARWFDARGRTIKERGEGAAWPNGDAKTFSGLEFLLLARLERKIADEVRDEARLQTSPGRLF